MSLRSNQVNAWISDVEEITLDDVHAGDNEPGYQICISVQTAGGDSFNLMLQAPKKENLAFRHLSDLYDWEGPPF
jgi:hypothetical protein